MEIVPLPALCKSRERNSIFIEGYFCKYINRTTLYYSESTQLVDRRFRESLLVYGCCIVVEFLINPR
ncbi:unnamed protein product [Lactuca virosa]|uniref:Uncharacterized protein n=1 Tax=Lactuca virosa TaxID=75947 RepID=A0AAU9NLP9_9ASTR|nr:unnamed protein product [Lactuca virosa]